MDLQLRNQRSAIAAAFFALAMTSISLAAEGITTIPEIITIKSVVETSTAEVPIGADVTVEGTVYYVDRVWECYFIGDGTGFIYVSGPKVENLKFGTRVRVHGSVTAGHQQPTINEKSREIREDAATEVAPPESVDLSKLGDGELEAHWIETTATVELQLLDGDRNFFRCLSGTEADKDRVPFTLCALLGSELSSTEAALGTTVRLRGNLGVSIDRRDEVAGHMVFLTNNVETLQPAESPLRPSQRRTVQEVKTADEAAFTTSGQVTYCDDTGFFLEDSQGGIWLSWPQPDMYLEPGVSVLVVGRRRVNEEGEAQFEARACMKSGYHALSEPVLSSIVGIYRDRPEHKRVRVQGAIESCDIDSDTGLIRLALSSEDTEFAVIIDATEETYSSLNLDSALSATVNGTCKFDVDDGNRFSLYVPSVADIQITQRQTSVGRNKVILGFATAAGLFVLGLIWAKSLQHQVRTKTSALSRLTAELRSSLDSIQDGILFIGDKQSVRAVNNKALGLFDAKFSTADNAGTVAQAFSQAGVEASFLQDWERLNTDKAEHFEARLQLSNPKERSLLVRSSPVADGNDEYIGRVWAFYDITEREMLQDSLAHARKQEAIGRVAGGFAHDFNNLLTGIIGSLSAMQLEPRQTIEQSEEQIDTALGAAERAASLVSQLLGFSRKTRLNLKVNNVNDIVRQVHSLLRPSLGSLFSIEANLFEDLPNVNVDATQLEQVLLNIFINARDAMADGGKIFVSTGTSIQCKPGSREDAEYVVVSIRDTGSGIPPDVRSKIFEPFFTTKIGKGTGLGLAMCDGIVQQHKGWIQCDSSKDGGTEFCIFLPSTRLQKASETTMMPKPVGGALSGKTVLVIDDEPLVRTASAAILHQHGVEVRTASGGQEGIDILATDLDKIDLVLLDWTMPGMSGKETLLRIKAAKADLPTIICSGYVFDSGMVERQADVTPEAVVQKPFTSQRILSEIHRVLQLELQGKTQVDLEAGGRSASAKHRVA